MRLPAAHPPALLADRAPWVLSRLRALPALAALAAASPARAADPAPPSPPASAARVVVTGTRVERPSFDVPASVDRLEGDVLRDDRPAVDLAETLGLLPGVTARNRQNLAQDVQVSIRGFGTRASFGIRGVRVVVDGIPATLPDGQGQLGHVDLASADRVEVLRGPFSALYGNSSGGVLQVFTADGRGPARFDAGAAGGSDGFARTNVRTAGAAGALGWVASLTHVGTAGAREHAAAYRDTANAKLTWQPTADDTVRVVANAMDLHAQDPLGLTREQFEADPTSADPAAERYDTRKDASQGQLGLQWRRRLSDRHQLDAMVYAGQRRTTQFQSIPSFVQESPTHPGGVIDLGRGYAGTDLRWTWRSAARGAWDVVGGLAFDVLGEDRRGFENFVGDTLGVRGALRRDEHNAVDSLDPYVQGSVRLGDAWRLDAGVRHSRVRVSSHDRFVTGANGDDSGATRFSATSPALGLLYAASDRLHLHASVGRGFETPTLNELAYRPDGATGLHLALRAARSDHAEVGAKWRVADGQAVQLALFEARTRDEIVVQGSSGGRTTYRNATATRRRGAELGGQVDWRDWRLLASATWLDAVYRDGFLQCAGSPCTTPTQAIPAGQPLPGVAPRSAAVSLDWAPAEGWRGGVEWRASSAVPVNDAGTDRAPGYAVTALQAGYVRRLGAVTLKAFVRVDNVFDRRYAGSVIVNEGNGRFFEPAPGRSVLGGLEAGYAF